MWRLKIHLINRENDQSNELDEKNITFEQAREQAKSLAINKQGRQFPFLECEKRIYDLVKSLWEKRSDIEQ